jgi:hypothetical protein
VFYTQAFDIGEDPAPNLKIEYTDEKGRTLKPKEAFRLLSHKFHGHGPGVKKREKKAKLIAEENSRKRYLAAANAPIQVGRNRGDTAARMRAKQKKTGLAYVVLDNKGVSAEPRSKGPQSDQKIAASARNKDKRSGTGEKLSRAEAAKSSSINTGKSRKAVEFAMKS